MGKIAYQNTSSIPLFVEILLIDSELQARLLRGEVLGILAF